MSRKLSLLMLLLGWACAHGAIWELAQVFAWARMYSGYAQTLPPAAALAKTFDPTRPCELCEVITTAKASDQESAPSSADSGSTKLVLASAPLAASIAPLPGSVRLEAPWSLSGPSRTRSVAAPPPKLT